MSHTEHPPTVGYISYEAGRRLEQRVREILAAHTVEAAARPAEPTLLDGAQATVAAAPAAPAAAREIVTRWLERQVPAGVLDDARLLVSELVTNSVAHADAPAGARVRIGVSLAAGVLRLEVGDHGDGGAVVRRDPDRSRGNGFGLNIVDSIATDWGVSRAGGTNVWCELATQPYARRGRVGGKSVAGPEAWRLEGHDVAAGFATALDHPPDAPLAEPESVLSR
jgi:anti-sigma regulatory factor (Ser/Thr protein kinase)